MSVHRKVRCRVVVVNMMGTVNCRESNLSLDLDQQWPISSSHESIVVDWLNVRLSIEMIYELRLELEEEFSIPSLTSKAAIVKRIGCSVTTSTDFSGPIMRPGRARNKRFLTHQIIFLPQIPSETSFRSTMTNLQETRKSFFNFHFIKNIQKHIWRNEKSRK